jgi:hypothetical protein
LVPPLQGTPDEPKSMSNKIVLYVLFIYGFVLCSSYSASLTSFLTVATPTLPFKNYNEMYHKSTYNIITNAGSGYNIRYKVPYYIAEAGHILYLRILYPTHIQAQTKGYYILSL